MNIIKSPIIIGISVCMIVSIVLYFKYKNNKDKNKRFNYIIPLIVGVLSWFFADIYVSHSQPTNANDIPTEHILPQSISQSQLPQPLSQPLPLPVSTDMLPKNMPTHIPKTDINNNMDMDMDMFIDITPF